MVNPRPIIDAHLDLAWSALYFNRDLTLSIDEVRRHETGMTDERARGHNTVTFPELRRAGISTCVATLLARGGPEQNRLNGYKRTDLDYINQAHAHAIARGQLAYYQELQRQGIVRLIRSREDLQEHWKRVGPDAPSTNTATPLGIILSMEGADPIISPAQVQDWWDLGLRAVGPAHYGRSHYAYGTGVSGPLSAAGRELLREFDRVGMILDVTHLCDQSMAEAFDLFGGRVLASHHNCRAIIPGDRQLTDDQIRRLVARDAVIGAALDAWMLYPNWIRGQTKPAVVALSAVVDHIDHICQLAGSVRHCAIGSDLDGGFGTEQTPHDLNTIADLQKLANLLAERRYSDGDIDLIFHGNWLRFFSEALPEMQ
ncbi:MAG TPA: membrane dipeptidase [Tepidisphaeraceae bacterium]|jgi:membrane dipeptidase|nr:membrane dipeptidase [Tepidisphaeraceae bacterium]